MSPGLREKLQFLLHHFECLTNDLNNPNISADPSSLKKISKEHSGLKEISTIWQNYIGMEQQLADCKELQKLDDAEMIKLAQEEEESIVNQLEQSEKQLYWLLIPKDPYDDNNIFLEIRAGTGGNEAALFAGDLYNMYWRYAENQRWKIEPLNISEGEMGGYKEIILRIVGKGAYSKLKFESGAHRVQRVPTNESQGRIHTSACTIAVIPEISTDEEIDINPADLRIDTFRASGAGGQHVNKTDSAIRITHLPTGIAVECQEGRSQHQNKAKAMTMLHARILDVKRQQFEKEQSAQRKSLVGSGDRSERIRTYNFPQGRVTDHRINLTEYKLDQLLQGNLSIIIKPLNHEYQAELMAQAKSS